MPVFTYLNSMGEGYAQEKEVAEGTTVKSFIDAELDSDDSESMIRVNRSPVIEGYVIKEGDTVTVTPTKVGGGK